VTSTTLATKCEPGLKEIFNVMTHVFVGEETTNIYFRRRQVGRIQ